MQPRLRLATDSDLAAISEIYNHYVLHSTSTFQIQPETLEQRQSWFRGRGARHPVTVCTLGEQVVGWGSLSPLSSREAFDRTAEHSVYLDHRHRGRGLGRALLTDLIERGRRSELHVLVGAICAEQEASLKLHQALGFVEVGRLREVGCKFDRWLDLVYVQRLLAPGQ